MEKCPLCNSGTSIYHKDNFREYYKCKKCELVHVPKKYYLDSQEEKKRYDLHTNNPNDKDYRKFLSRMFEPMVERIPNGSSGLDFGSGPGPTLSIMLEEAGYKMKIYDLFYADDKSTLRNNYDFITTTEVVEHLKNPLETLDFLYSILNQDGFLGVMTKMPLDKEQFAKWHYITDETHISFFSKKTFEWLAKRWNAKLEFIGDDVIIFQKIK